MLERTVEFANSNAVSCMVLPLSWMLQARYATLREHLLRTERWNILARLGPRAFETISGERVSVGLTILTHRTDAQAAIHLRGVEATALPNAQGKADALQTEHVVSIRQAGLRRNPDSRILLELLDSKSLLQEHATCIQGLATSDDPQFTLDFWELESIADGWVPLDGTVQEIVAFGGRERLLRWEDGRGRYYRHAMALKREGRLGGWKSGTDARGKAGVLVSQMSILPTTLYTGHFYDHNASVLVPKNESDLLAIWAFASSPSFREEVRRIDESLKPSNKVFVKIPFDLEYWNTVASQEYPHGLPKPHSNDPTQWIFHGHPAISDHALQVAVARLLGYRWPAELDEEMELAEDARAWIERSGELTDFGDNDGIVCIPAVGTEQPAEDRLLNLLHKAYEDGRAVERQFQEKLDAGDTNDALTVALLQRAWKPSLPGSFNDWLSSLLEAADHTGKSLGSWLRDKFFTQHFKLFHHRPFIWHIWDGLKDGFSVLVNYHRLDNKRLKTLIYTYLNDWINRQKQDAAAGVDGSEEKLAAAGWLKERLELILNGESPHDMFVRWKRLEEQSIGWNPDCNDGVRLNIRPWMTTGDAGKKGAGLLRDKPNINWKKDRGKDVESAPWFSLGPMYGGKKGDRINDHHLSLAEKQAADHPTEGQV